MFVLFVLAKEAGIADVIQPGLVPLQPNLDDYMDASFHGECLTR